MINKNKLIKILESRINENKPDNSKVLEIAPLKDILNKVDNDDEYRYIFLLDVSDEQIEEIYKKDPASIIYLKKMLSIGDVSLTTEQKGLIDKFKDEMARKILKTENKSASLFANYQDEISKFTKIVDELKEGRPLDEQDYNAINLLNLDLAQEESIIDFLNSYNIGLYNNYTVIAMKDDVINEPINEKNDDYILEEESIKSDLRLIEEMPANSIEIQDRHEMITDEVLKEETLELEEIGDSIGFDPFLSQSFDYVKPEKNKKDKNQLQNRIKENPICETLEKYNIVDSDKLFKNNIYLSMLNEEDFKEKIDILDEYDAKIEDALKTNYFYFDNKLILKNNDILKTYGFNIRQLTDECLCILGLDNLNVIIDQFLEMGMHEYLFETEGNIFRKLKSLIIKKAFYSFKNNLNIWNLREEDSIKYKLIKENEISNLKNKYSYLLSVDEVFKKNRLLLKFDNQYISRIKFYSVFNYYAEKDMDLKKAVIISAINNTNFDNYINEKIVSLLSKIVGE